MVSRQRLEQIRNREKYNVRKKKHYLSNQWDFVGKPNKQDLLQINK